MKTTNYLLQSVYPDGCSRRKNRHYWRSDLKTKTNRAILEALTTSYNGGFEFKDGTKQANEYAYDANGNLTKDLNKGISNINYNCLNLPSSITFVDGIGARGALYAGDGTLLQLVHKVGNNIVTTRYCDNVIYENGTPKYLLTAEGYVTLADRKYHYFLQDHQGNNRVVVDAAGAVEEVNHYYPFGGLFASSGKVQPYKYNGKEYDDQNGVNWYDYGARMYDAATGRFTTQDRFAEKYYAMSPYQYGANNPVRNIDINGDTIVTTLTTKIDGKMANINYTYRAGSDGQYGFFDSSGNKYSGNDSFMNNLSGALASLREGSVGSELVEELMASSNVVNIANRKENGAASNGTYIKWNPIKIEGGLDHTGNIARPPFIGLGHEMAHIQDVWHGTYDSSIWFTVKQKDGRIRKIQNAEKYSTHIENLLRSEHNLPLRSYYTDVEYPEAGLLIPNTRISLFYKQKEKIGSRYFPSIPFVY